MAILDCFASNYKLNLYKLPNLSIVVHLGRQELGPGGPYVKPRVTKLSGQ